MMWVLEGDSPVVVTMAATFQSLLNKFDKTSALTISSYMPEDCYLHYIAYVCENSS